PPALSPPHAATRSRKKAMGGHLAMTVDWAEQGTLGYAAPFEPVLHRPDRAGLRVRAIRYAQFPAFTFLIGFRAPNRHHQPFPREFGIAPVERNQFGASKSTTEADQK